MASNVADSIQLPVAERARRRITKRLMPYLLLLYFIAFIDRTNVSVAALHMKDDLSFSDAVIGTGAGIFFIGYFLLEIPGTLIVENWSARKWIARIMISWGIVAAMMGLIGTSWLNFASLENQFYGLRFILGLAEAGFFPGIIVYLSHWFRYEDRAKAKAFFMIGIPIATVIGVPLSQLIMHNITWYGWAGWRWVFILEGVPSIFLGITTLFFLTDRPHQARWLPDDEKAWIIGELEKERREKMAAGQENVAKAFISAFMAPQTYLLAGIYLFIVTGYYGLTFFLPSITAKMEGTSVVTQTIVTMLPYVFGLFAMLIVGHNSDRTGERRWHTALPILLAGIAMALSIRSGDNLALVVTFLCLVGIGVHAYIPVFWTWPTKFFAASTAATTIGLINSVGNLGGYFGPKVVGVLSTRSGSYENGLWFLVVCIMVAGLLATQLRPPKRAIQPVPAAAD
ncbi:MAG: MFS transporter [Acidobacteriota bacterium]|nr:MAG: MFS transporter [Acidobacteriota bacterium]